MNFKRFLPFILVILFPISLIYPQELGTNPKLSTKVLKEAVVLIKESLYSDKVGSGLLLEHEKSYFLITAEHVKKVTSSDSYISCGKLENDTISIKITDLIDKSLPMWRTHPNADLSVLKLSNKKGKLEPIKNQFLNSKYFVQVLPDSTIHNYLNFYIVGFPLGYGSYPVFNPSVKTSKLASNQTFIKNSSLIYGKNDVFEGKNLIHILLEDPSVGGFSGGPVYYPGGSFDERLVYGSTIPKCIGIVSGTIGDSTGGKMAIITPSFLIFDLLY